MANKYGKYFLKQTKPHAKIGAATPAALEGSKNWSGIQHRLVWSHISAPVMIDNEPHSHDFDQFFCFVGGDPTKPMEFGAVAELSLGVEGEKQVIDSSTIVCIPKGLVHGPLSFTKVDKPVIFCDIITAPEHVKKLATR